MGLDFSAAFGQSAALHDVNWARSSPLKMNQLQIPAVDGESGGEQFRNQVEAPEPTLRRS